jgi:hypothetical protein
MAWKQVLGAVQLKLDDLSFVETRVCLTITVLLKYEAMVLAASDRGSTVIAG